MRGLPYQARIAASGGTGVAYAFRALDPLPAGLEIWWENRCPSWGSFTVAGMIDGGLPAPRLRAVSGLAASRRQPGIFWAHDDADSRLPEVYALEEDGTHRQTYRLDIDPTDWEDVALGPAAAGKEYVYLGDFGDNHRSRSQASLIRFEEPTVPAAAQVPLELPFEVLHFKFPDGARDIETLFFDWETGTPYLIERNASGCQVFKFPLPLDPSLAAGDPLELLLVTPTAILPQTLTGGDSTRDGLRILVRNYTTVFEYARQAKESFDDLFFTSPCVLGDAGVQQYEGITYGADGTRIYTTTERAGQASAPILVSPAAPEALFAAVQGVPAASGEFSFTIEVRDSAGTAATRVVTLKVEAPPPTGQVPGDCDQSGAVDISDAICTLKLLFELEEGGPPCGGAGPPEGEAALLDFNGDGGEDISDAVALLLYLFAEGRPHALGKSCRVITGCAGRCAE